jgi:hypothetical protein
MENLKDADVVFTKGFGLLSRAIRFFTRGIGESRTKVNHVGLVVSGGPIAEAVIVEALSMVKRHRLMDRYGPRRDHVAVYRSLDLTEAETRRIAEAAEGYVGRKYGYATIAAHLLDWVLLGAYVFRRFVGCDNYPICSWLVAHAYKKVGKHFGVPARAASPDEIWDFVVENPDKFRMIRDLAPLDPG